MPSFTAVTPTTTIQPSVFSESRLAAYVQALDTEAPPGKRVALVGIANRDGVEFRVAAKIAGAWTLGAVVSKKPGQALDYGVRVQAFF